MAGYLVGDSFGGIQQASTAEDSQRHAAFANAMANMIAGLRERNAVNLSEAQMDLQSQHLEAQKAYQDKELELRRDEAIWRNAQAQKHNDISQQFVDMQKEAVKNQAGQPTAAQEHDRQFQENMAFAHANAGRIADADHAKQLFPWMSDPEAQMLADVSQESQSQQKQSYKDAQNMAETLNRHQELSTQLNKVNRQVKEVPWYQSSGPIKQTQQQLQEQVNSLTPTVNTIKQDKRFGALVNFDPQQGKYVPAVAPPIQPTKMNTAPTERTTGDEPWSDGSAGGGAGSADTGRPTAPPSFDRFGNRSDITNPGPPQDMAPAGMMGLPPTSGTGTARRKYPPQVYDRVNYWSGQNLSPQESLQRSLGEYQQLFGELPQ